MRPKRPTPIDVSRSRSRSPMRVTETAQLTAPLRKCETKQVTESLHKSETKMVLSASGVFVEPKTPPGPPPYLKSKIKRPMIRNVFNTLL